MKAITLHQPWASLVAIGVKTILDTSWPAPKGLIGQRLLIHASVKVPLTKDVGDWSVFYSEPHGVKVMREYGKLSYRDGRLSCLPLGAIVASATLTDCVPMVDTNDRKGLSPTLLICPSGLYRSDRDSSQPDYDRTDQLPYGDFAPGRWAWLLDDVKPTTERCPACWGTGWNRPVYLDGGFHQVNHPCKTCSHVGSCPPISWKGKQRVWECSL